MPWRARSGGSGAGTPGSSSFAWSDPRLGRAGMARRSSPASECVASSSRLAARRGSCRRAHSARRPRVTTRRAAGAATRARRPAGCGRGGRGERCGGWEREVKTVPFAHRKGWVDTPSHSRKHRPGNRPQAPKQETGARQTNVLGRSQEASTASARDRRSNYVQRPSPMYSWPVLCILGPKPIEPHTRYVMGGKREGGRHRAMVVGRFRGSGGSSLGGGSNEGWGRWAGEGGGDDVWGGA